MGLSLKDKDIMEKILLIGINIYAEYDDFSIDYDEIHIENIKELIIQEEKLYSAWILNFEKCHEIIDFGMKHYRNVDDFEKDFKSMDIDEVKNYYYAFSLLRLFAHIKERQISINYASKGYLQAINDMAAELKYTLLLEVSAKEASNDLALGAFTKLSSSSKVEKMALDNGLNPFNSFHDYIKIFLESKREQEINEFAQKYNIKLSEVPLLSIDIEEMKNKILNSIINSSLDESFGELKESHDFKDTSDPSFLDYITSYISLKTYISMFSKEMRIKLYEKYLKKAMGDEKMTKILEEAFTSIEKDIVPRIIENNPNKKI